MRIALLIILVLVTSCEFETEPLIAQIDTTRKGKQLTVDNWIIGNLDVVDALCHGDAWSCLNHKPSTDTWTMVLYEGCKGCAKHETKHAAGYHCHVGESDECLNRTDKNG